MERLRVPSQIFLTAWIEHVHNSERIPRRCDMESGPTFMVYLDLGVLDA